MNKNSCPFLDNAGAGKCYLANYEICPYWFKGCPFSQQHLDNNFEKVLEENN